MTLPTHQQRNNASEEKLLTSSRDGTLNKAFPFGVPYQLCFPAELHLQAPLHHKATGIWTHALVTKLSAKDFTFDGREMELLQVAMAITDLHEQDSR